MTDYTNEAAALAAIDDEAAADAYEWLKREKPQTLASIEFLVYKARWSGDRVLGYLADQYRDTEPRAQHKMKLAVEALVREKDG